MTSSFLTIFGIFNAPLAVETPFSGEGAETLHMLLCKPMPIDIGQTPNTHPVPVPYGDSISLENRLESLETSLKKLRTDLGRLIMHGPSFSYYPLQEELGKKDQPYINGKKPSSSL